MATKTRVAFVKFGGLASGGTERFIQNIAANLPKDQYDVTYFYCDAAPYVGSDWKHPDTDLGRKAFVESHGVKLVKFEVAFKNVTIPTHPWVNTNFFDVFKEEDYDIIQTGRAGHPEYPFTEIHKTTIVDAVTLPGMAERKENVAKVIHISKFQADTWIKAGGDATKSVVIPVFSDIRDRNNNDNLREKLGIEKGAFVFGMHQRDDNGIASSIPLQAYQAIQRPGLHYILMGGGPIYSEWAQKLNLTNFHHLPHGGDAKDLNRFLNTLNAFAHGRSDGETFGLAIAEAMSFDLPIISHAAPAMGHVETIGSGGRVTIDLNDYVTEMTNLSTDAQFYNMRSEHAAHEYSSRLSTEVNMKKIIGIYERVMHNKTQDDLSDDDFWNQQQ